MTGKRNFDDFKVGQQFKETRHISFEDVKVFAEIVGDKNPIHLDKDFAEKSSFKGRIVHGAFLIGFISKILGMDFPGPGTIYLSQEIKFFRPIYVDTSISIILEIIEIDPIKQYLNISTIINNEKGKASVGGIAKLWFP